MDRVWKRKIAEPGRLLKLSLVRMVSWWWLRVGIRDILGSQPFPHILLSHNQSGWIHSFHHYIFVSLHLNSVSAFILMTEATYDSESGFILYNIPDSIKWSSNHPPFPPLISHLCSLNLSQGESCLTRAGPITNTWGMVFILLYLWTSSSLEGILCCPFPIPVTEQQTQFILPFLYQTFTQVPGTELDTWHYSSQKKTNYLRLQNFSLVEITGKEQVIMTQYGEGSDPEEEEEEKPSSGVWRRLSGDR